MKQFEETEPPYRLRDNMDVFSWSVPFLVEKIIGMFTHIVLKLGADEDDQFMPVESDPISAIKVGATKNKATRKSIFKIKLAGLSKMQKMFETLRNEREDLMKIKNISPDGKLPIGLLMTGKKGIQNHLKQFEDAMKLDAVNEKRPVLK